MRIRKKINSLFGFIAGWLLSIFGRSPAKPTDDDLARADFKANTQRLGVRFTERIRDIFRFKWIRKY